MRKNTIWLTTITLAAISLIMTSSIFASQTAQHLPIGKIKPSGAYTTLYLGALKPENRTVSNTLIPPSSYALKNQYGGSVEVALGYRKHNWRGEFALGYSYAKIDKIALAIITNPVPLTISKQYRQTFRLMTNIFYDYNNTSGMIPYVGIGGGLVQVNQRVDGIDETGAVADNTFALRGNDLLFAYQVIIGLACPVNAHLRTSIDYRYSGTSRGNFAIFTGEDGLSSRLPVRSKLTSHRLMLGLTYFMK